MAFTPYPYSNYQNYYNGVPAFDQLNQMRQNQLGQPMMQQPYQPQQQQMQFAQPTQQNQMQMPQAQAQPQVQAQPMQAPPPNNSNGIIWVQGESGAKAYMVAAGTSVMLFDSEDNVFYLKSTDQSGMPQPLRIFDYTERAANAPNSIQAAQTQQAVSYVTQDEFDALAAKVDALSINSKPATKPTKTKKEEATENGEQSV